MDKKLKILMVDRSSDRKQRIMALKHEGYSVYPALKLSEARSRCKPGTYDLIVVNGAEEPAEALEFCDFILARSPKQPLLMMTPESTPAERDFTVSSDPESLREAVKSLMGGQKMPNDAIAA
jgi:DNA-binding response OmpR family regulator